MKWQSYFNYLLIIMGSVVAIYGQSGEQNNVTILIIGIVLLMLGVYRISRNIPSKFDTDDSNENNPL